MSVQTEKGATFNVAVSDAYDGLVRLLVDAQRFGLALRSVTATTRDDGCADVALTVEMIDAGEIAQIVDRFLRHPSVLQANTAELACGALPPAESDIARGAVRACEKVRT